MNDLQPNMETEINEYLEQIKKLTEEKSQLEIDAQKKN